MIDSQLGAWEWLRSRRPHGSDEGHSGVYVPARARARRAVSGPPTGRAPVGINRLAFTRATGGPEGCPARDPSTSDGMLRAQCMALGNTRGKKTTESSSQPTLNDQTRLAVPGTAGILLDRVPDDASG